MIVIDASAVLDLLLGKPDVAGVRDRLLAPRQTLHAPHLLDVEVAQVVRRFAAAGEIDDVRSAAVLGDLIDLPIRRHPHDLLLPRIWQLRHNMTAYDAAYVALAEMLDMPLVTRDRRLAAAAGHLARIELV